MSPTERIVLSELVVSGSFYRGFAPLMAATGLDRNVVRRCCRSLARKGYAEFARGLWDEGGEPAGSGYRASATGQQIIFGNGSTAA